MPSVTSAEIVAALDTMRAVIETIRDARRVPSGTLYAGLMNTMDLSAFEKMMALIVNTGLVRRAGQELVWVG